MTSSTSNQANQKHKQTALKGIPMEERPAAKVNPCPAERDNANLISSKKTQLAPAAPPPAQKISPKAVKPSPVEITPLPEGVASLWQKALTRDMNEANGKSRFADPELRRYLDEMNKLSAGKDHQVRPEWTPKALKSA